MSLSKCPAEILHHIFSLACTDGGRTGRALARVSRVVAAVSSRTRLRSIQAAGEDELRALVNLLERAHPNARSTVRDLLICDRRGDQADDQPQPVRMPHAHDGNAGCKCSQAGGGGEGWFCDVEREAEEQEMQAQSDAVNRLVRRLLALAGPTLQTLTCLIFDPNELDLFATVAGAPLPRLTALTIRFSASPAYMPMVLRTKIQLPNLRLLRVTPPQLIVLRSLFAAPALISAACPTLEEIAILEVPTYPRHFVDALCCLLHRETDVKASLLPLVSGNGSPIASGGSWLANPSVCATLPRFGDGGVRRVNVEPLDVRRKISETDQKPNTEGSKDEDDEREKIELKMLKPVLTTRGFEDWRKDWLQEIFIDA
ncbi:hypothetical protein PUNSTDRAFT_122832 [Punctularia strigosozonata HHB-11173 SS5]|uniref:Uncharacterized protein n=1 Tax=Punctularia strigosozonata (strain HHB-11173) TaxID=741275 RepID=R7S3R8_PUNST|nr:uncharacterized protein PUNSTDRAFT_122832 [Punctularia strigosozonata HHB-11173 SS5]EIN04504.1 hypothetical protein PUNSTDRAFT_122832 [Punctularia strigosozonata HHB-11173 SS5]